MPATIKTQTTDRCDFPELESLSSGTLVLDDDNDLYIYSRGSLVRIYNGGQIDADRPAYTQPFRIAPAETVVTFQNEA